jgi:hypothetical protein
MDDKAQALFLARTVVFLAEQLYKLSLRRGHVPPYGPHDNLAFDWMRNPSPGDLVIEKTSLALHPQRVGRLLGMEPDGFGGQRVYFVIGWDGEFMRWENCEFIRIPDPNDWPRGGVPLKELV